MPNPAEIDKILPFLSGYILKSASQKTNTNQTQKNQTATERLNFLLAEVEGYLWENAYMRS